MKFRQIIIITLLSLVFSACGDKNAEEAGDSSDIINKKPRIALIMKSLANEFFVSMAAGARAHGDAGRWLRRGRRTRPPPQGGGDAVARVGGQPTAAPARRPAPLPMENL